MNAWSYLLIAIFVIDNVLTISKVGKPRDPLSGQTAAATLVVSVAVCYIAIVLAH